MRKGGATLIYDIDDLVFDLESVNKVAHIASGDERQLADFTELVRRQAWSFELADFVTVTTFALGKHAEKLGKKAFVIPNNISHETLAIADANFREQRVATDAVRVGYLSGTATHQADFEICAGALRQVMLDHQNVIFVCVGELDLPEWFCEGLHERLEKRPLMNHSEMLETLASFDINIAPLVPNNRFTECKSELKVFEAAALSVPTVATPTSPYASVIEQGKSGMLAFDRDDWCFALEYLILERDARIAMGVKARLDIAERFAIDTVGFEAIAVYRAAISGHWRRTEFANPQELRLKPVISVVTVLYNKADQVRFFLEALRRQNFDLPFEVILVDDLSPDNSVDIVEEFDTVNMTLEFSSSMELRVIKNEQNVGNCGSRNRGISEAVGEYIIVVDADCMFNSDFLNIHYSKYLLGDCDVVIGPINIETNGRPPLSVLSEFEADVRKAREESQPQDEVNLDSFINCITRNFSISRKFLEANFKEPLFDEDFSYSRSPDSGFGWEDVEMGVRVYLSGGRIKYDSRAVSIHVSHDSSSNESEKPVRSLKNFRRLVQKHPDISRLSPDWFNTTYLAIVNWCKSVGSLEANEDYLFVERHVQGRPSRKSHNLSRRKLRVLTYRWHVPHQYELYKMPYDFVLVTGLSGLADSWEYGKRPMPDNVQMIHYSEIKPEEYDFAVIHFDENVLSPEMCNDKVPLDWGRSFKWFIEQTTVLPSVCVCHGTPQFYGQYDLGYSEANLLLTIEDARQELVDLIADRLVICNSHQARSEWGFRKSRTIWHGFSPHEYPLGPRDHGILSMGADAYVNRPHYNGQLAFNVISRLLVEIGIQVSTLSVDDPSSAYAPNTNDWAQTKYHNYARQLSQFGIFLNLTLRSPMPRTRGEAMMAGLVPVSMNNHDVDLFIVNGVNGFIGSTEGEINEYLQWLIGNPAKREKIGNEARRTAFDIFSQSRFLADWDSLIHDLIG
jgi:glycosyltransferase involved in cell wall biosynthesis